MKRKNYWKISIIWSKWKEIWNKNIQQPNTKERNGISFSKEEIFQMEKNEFIETITMNYIFWKTMILNIYISNSGTTIHFKRKWYVN